MSDEWRAQDAGAFEVLGRINGIEPPPHNLSMWTGYGGQCILSRTRTAQGPYGGLIPKNLAPPLYRGTSLIRNGSEKNEVFFRE